MFNIYLQNLLNNTTINDYRNCMNYLKSSFKSYVKKSNLSKSEPFKYVCEKQNLQLTLQLNKNILTVSLELLY